MTVLITLSGVGSSAGPTFNLYASPDGITFTTIVLGINKTVLEAGYTATVPNGTTDIKVTSVGACTNSYVATIGVIPTTTTTTTATPIQEYCVNWTAANIGGGKMSTQGYINFAAILAGRTVATASCEGNVTGYIVNNVLYPCSIPMDFSVSPLATWDTDLLDAVTGTVLNSLIYTVYVEFTDSSYYPINNGQTFGTVAPGGLTSSYNNCTP